MNRQIAQLFGLSMVLFAVLVAFTSQWSVFGAQALEDNTKNRRPLIEEQQIPRGVIRAANGRVLARSVGSGSGNSRIYRRTYPSGSLFSHAVGYSFVSKGRAGLERSRNDALTGDEGEFGTIFSQLQSQKREGKDVTTTLDQAGQQAALQALGGRKGSIVAIEPQTGRVRVMVSIPEYDPNDIPTRFAEFNRSKDAPLLNRATQSRYPPGSTFKVVTAAAALDSGKYTPDSVVDGSSPRDVSGVPLANSGGEDFGPISLTDALTNSVNTVWAQVGENIGRKTLEDYMGRFGFNEDPQLDYPDGQMTASGVRSDTGKLLTADSGFDVGRVAIGQGGSEGAIQATPLQMAQVAGAVGNKGRLVRPRLTEKIVAKDGRADDIRPVQQSRVMSEKAAGQLTQMMGNVVEEGTGTAAALSGAEVGGKTGTAEVDNATANQAWFIGFAPLDNPKMAIAVTIERTQGQGGTEAAPLAKQVLEALLGPGGREVSDVATDTVVDGRYKIVDRIGSGGMADVYRAEDTHLGREVALKILHRRFAQDAEFVERFRREARAAAGLQHPHVVGVYDRGEHEGTYYIAMELLEGRTLKDIVTAEAPLDQLRVIELGRQVLQAAEFAHKRGVIHRDFKPHNVIVDADGQAKVTDFGIARAGASEMTETGSIMGTAQYLSPEQAQGHPVTAASDVYSIGVMLYEMLTGKLPFEGDSAVSIALKHLSDNPPPMSEHGVQIEPNLEAVVMGALAKEPASRWQSASDFADALEACKPYVEALHGGEPDNGTKDFAAVAVAPVPVNGNGDDRDEEKRRRWLPWLIGALVLALIAVMAYAFTRPEETSVPKVEGLTLTKARDRLERDGFEKVAVERERSNAEVDTVLRQDPDAGETATAKDTITLIVSRGPGNVRVPSVRNTSRQLAIRELQKQGLEVTADTEASGSVRKGFATRTSPGEGTSVERGSRVRLFVSSGPAKVEVPDVVGLTREAAETRLTRARLDVNVELRDSDAPENEVIRQSPSGGASAERGDEVTIVVSRGKQQTEVPNVTGLDLADARRVLRGEGLGVTVRQRTTTDRADDGQVLEQRPSAGQDVDDGASVIVVVGDFQAPSAPPTTTPQTTTPEATP